MTLQIRFIVGAALVATSALAVPPGYEWAPDPLVAPPTEALSSTPCVGGNAGPYPCDNIDLLAFVPHAGMGCGSGNDVWGWLDPITGTEYALMGCNNGTSFVDLSDPANPVYVGRLPTRTFNSSWRDIKVYADHAFVVSEASGHGMQVFDLSELREVTDPPVVFQATATLDSFNHAHNVAINEATGYAYVLGSNQCSGGLHIVDVQTPTSPQAVGCFSADGYTHDAQCVIYQGPDESHQGSEICFNSNEDTLTIVDVTNKSAPVMLARQSYLGVGYAHQGWLTEDHRFFLLDDELDEIGQGHNTRTRIWDVSNLETPFIIGVYDSSVPATDHNQYVRGGHVYQSNYTSGLRILDLAEVAGGALTEVAYFDIYPANNNPGFNGTWSNYPYFDSGIVIVSGIGEGLFVLQPVLGEGGIGFDPASLGFGDVPVGTTSAPQTAMLQNTGDVDLTGLTFSGLPDGGFEADTSACGTDLAVGAQCPVSVTFTPAQAGPAAATLSVGSDQGAAASLALSGEGVSPSEITLAAVGRKVRGVHTIDLSWSGASSTEIDVRRDGTLIATVPNSGAHTDSTGRKGKATYIYQVCEAGTSDCSNEATVVFGGG